MGLRIEGSFSCINTYLVSLLLGVLATPGVAAPVASVTIVRSTPNPAVAGQAVTFTAGVNLTATQFVTGTITLTDTFQGVPDGNRHDYVGSDHRCRHLGRVNPGCRIAQHRRVLQR